MTARPQNDELEILLLERYCSGAASVEEQARIEAWFREHPGRLEWYEQLRATLQKDDFVPISAEERRAAWSEIIRQALQRCHETERLLLGADTRENAATVPAHEASVRHRHDGERGGEDSVRSSTIARTRRVSERPVWRWAAYVATGLAAAISLILIGRHSASWSPKGRLAAVTTYATRRGERADITLPDGSTVTLNVASRLDVPADYAAGHRTVTLIGEALFHVVHRAGTPFTVLSGGVSTKVLGTTFLVRRYATDAGTTVAVHEGKVAVDAVVVSARQQVTATMGAITHKPADLKQFLFATGVLSLSGVPMSQAIEELDRWYDADVRFGDSAVRNHVLDGTFVGGSLSDLSDVLALALNARVVRDGRVLTLYTK